MECKVFSVVGWMVVCPHCETASGQVPTNAGYVKCAECGEWSYNEEYDQFKGEG